jgi:hypothetical protein
MIAICRTARNCQEACQSLTWPGEYGPHAIAAPSAGRAPRLAGEKPGSGRVEELPAKGMTMEIVDELQSSFARSSPSHDE